MSMPAVMLVKIATAVLVLTLFIELIEGYESVIVVVTESDDCHDLSSDDENDRVTRSSSFGNDSYASETSCCVYGNCSCPSLYSALVNLTSNILINITTDMKLSSIVILSDLTNISISGHNNPTVYCNNSGGLHFMSCNNCTVEGITWEGCGARNINDDNNNVYPVLQQFNSSNIIIKNCTFQHSIGQAVALYEMSGDVKIDNCNFISNKQYRDHGTALYCYSSSYTSPNKFTFTNCIFSSNEGGKSVTYFQQTSTGSLYIKDLKFYQNKGVPIYLANQNVHIIGNIEFHNNTAENGSGLLISDHSNVTFHNNIIANFTGNAANENGGAIFLINHSSILCDHPIYYDGQNLQMDAMRVMFYNNTAKYGGAIYAMNSSVIFGEYAVVMIADNNVELEGGAVYSVYSTVIFEGNSTVSFNGNIAHVHGGAMAIYTFSNITFKANCKATFLSNSANHEGGTIMTQQYSNIAFEGNSKVLFNSNAAHASGGAVASYYSNIAFDGHSAVNFTSNVQPYSGTVYVTHSIVTFQGNSTVMFCNNNATEYNAGALHVEYSSNITFKGWCRVIFNGNSAQTFGGAAQIKVSCFLTFEENSNVTFYGNKAKVDGGALHIYEFSHLIFTENSMVTFLNNSVNNEGGAIMTRYTSSVKFEGNSKILFNSNFAHVHGGAMACYHCTITFDGYSVVKCINNSESLSGGMFGSYSMITFQGNSTVMFCDNSANTQDGGALSIEQKSNITFKEQCTVTFDGNSAYENGGAVNIDQYCVLTFEGNSNVTFHANKARIGGGALYIGEYSNVTFKEYCSVKFCENSAHESGGAVTIFDYSIATFKGSSTVKFNINNADSGGAMTLKDNGILTVEENSTVQFNSNTASLGGAMMIRETSAVTFEGTSNVTFVSNSADHNGGTIYIVYYSNITFDGNSTINFHSNTADNNGGVMYTDHHSAFTTKENIKVTCNDNRADFGGSIFLESSNVTIEGNSSIMFTNNTALQDGGAIYFGEHSNTIICNTTIVTFYNNTALYYGGAIYVLPKGTSINFNNSDIYFMNNAAGKVQASVYIKLPKSCIGKCLGNINIATSNVSLGTSPNKLMLYNAAKCANGSDTDCDTYYMNHVMLGQEITLVACVMDYYDQPAEVTEFSVTGMNDQQYKITNLLYISVSCNHTTRGISVIGNLHSNSSYNYSITISSYIFDSKRISINLIVQLIQCHPGFWFSNASQKCECYNAKNFISCSGSSSTIKRGYWFGSVNGKPTVASCPSEYCNFTCCEITNGIYHLSPVRANQCIQHRSGIACGNCKNGYTLSFDSPKCVEVDKCSNGQKILIAVLSLLYWIAAVVTVFVMIYFNVTIGSLYGIVYYYSVVDILLGRVIFMSNGLYSTISIVSSLTKLTPQFLGQLCLVTNMSGIDQQFIHYVHPTVVMLILFVIIMLARKSHKVSSFVSRGIIQFICFLLLLSYTSIATTSLLLMRPLTFIDINKVYIYLSPDREYFHGRHLVYGIVAIIFAIIIVIAFPLLLLLEPFLNSKINFVKIKPLLDQFQGCYKDKYRCFAGYYMVCRLVIVLLVIVKTSDDYTTTQYLLISSCVLMALIHLLVRPYASTFYNVFDGIMLQLIVIISVLSMIQLFDDYNETFVLVISYLLVILPLTSFIAARLWINKNDILNGIKDFREKFTHKYNVISNNDAQEITAVEEFGIVVDDSMRSNATVVDV